MKSAGNKISSSVKMYFKILPIIFKCEPLYMSMMFLLSILASAIYGIMTIISANFFDAVSKSIGVGHAKPILAIAFIFSLFIIGNQISDGLSNFMYLNFLLKIQGKLKEKIHESASDAESIFFEDTKYLDAINKADQGIVGAYSLIGCLDEIIVYQLPYLIIMGIYLFNVNPILVLSLIVIFIPAFIMQFLKCSVYNKLEQKSAPLRRELEYYQSAICSRENFKETRLLGACDFFEKKLSDCLERFNAVDRRLKLIISGMETVADIISIIAYGTVVALLIILLIKNDVTIGEFSAIFASVATMFSKLQIVSNRLMGFSQFLPLAKNFYDFLNLPQIRTENGKYEDNSEIVLNNVSFAYPDAGESTLSDINLIIKPHQRIAIVGENGAGKSTLAKLISGLYMPTGGTITLGGLDTSEISGKVFYKHSSALFQNFQRYKLDLEDNIEISDFNSYDDYKKSLAMSELDIDDASVFPEGGKTILSKEFGGVDLSGGLWQRVALARAVYKNSDLIILDEPTSAIDPIEETKLYHKFIEITEDKTAVIVTHRLGLARYMDRIVVIENGKVIEDGNHEDLINRHGKYESMWKLQSEIYTVKVKLA